MKESKFFLQAGRARTLLVAAVFLTSSLALVSRAAGPAVSPTAPGDVAPSTPSRALAAYGSLPLSFEANQGQVDRSVNFVARGPRDTVYLAPTEAVFVVPERNSAPGTRREPGGVDPVGEAVAQGPASVLRMKLEGSNSQAAVSGLDELEGKVNYFIGNDPANWHVAIPTFERVRYASVYQGVDLVYYGNQRELEYDFVVGPGADYKQIALRFEGASHVEVDAASGDLLLQVGGTTLRQRKPVVYQEVNGERKEIKSGYLLGGGGRVGFAVEAYDARKPLIIDPVLTYSSYLGGNDLDAGGSLTVDSSGNAYVAGTTRSLNFPTANALQVTFGGPVSDAFVTKLNAAGTAFIYSTYLGGSGADLGRGVVVDASGNAYVTGGTASSNFPTVSPIQASNGGGTSDAFVTKLNAAGSALIYSTYLGGSGNDNAGTVTGIAVDPSGNACVTGNTSSTNFPTANAFDATLGGGRDAYVSKLNAAGSAFIYSTYLGGTGSEDGLDLTVDSSGNAYATGRTGSSNFPTTAGAFQTTSTVSGTAFVTYVTKLNAAGSALSYSTYVAGTSTASEAGLDIAVDSSGNAYVTGQTSAADFPTTPGAFQQTIGGGTCGSGICLDGFVTKLNAAGSAASYSTYLGGNDTDFSSGITVDASGNAYVTGAAASANFPVTSGAFQRVSGGSEDAFVTKLNSTGSTIISSTYLGGTSVDTGLEIALDPSGNVYVAGNTSSDNFPTIGAIQATRGGGQDGFVAKMTGFAAPPSVLANISTRLRVETGDNALFGGFIITGTENKRVLLRGLGPSTNVGGSLSDTVLELYDDAGNLLRQNDNWEGAPNRQEIIDTTIPPPSSFESAILMSLPGNGSGYTAILRGFQNETGIGLVEAYDLDRAVDSKLANISTRGFVQAGDNVLIAGTIIVGPVPQKVIVRAIGPSLPFGGVMGDPLLELRNVNGTLLAANDNWRSSQEAEIIATSIPPTNDLESAIVTTLPANGASYTAIVRGVGNTTGVAVVEVYALN